MGKSLFIAEKPSVAMEFAKALDMNLSLEEQRQSVKIERNTTAISLG